MFERLLGEPPQPLFWIRQLRTAKAEVVQHRLKVRTIGVQDIWRDRKLFGKMRDHGSGGIVQRSRTEAQIPQRAELERHTQPIRVCSIPVKKLAIGFRDDKGGDQIPVRNHSGKGRELVTFRLGAKGAWHQPASLSKRVIAKGSFTPLKMRGFWSYSRAIRKELLSDWQVMRQGQRVALYARVSTLDKGQDPETQLYALREYAERRGFRLVGEYVDHASGGRDDCPQYRALFTAARKRQLDVVLVWRYDRFARSTQALVNALKEFQHLGVDFISYQENIDTTTPQGELIFTVMASLAQFESALISERVKAGMARAKAQGKRIARQPIPVGVQRRIAQLHASRTSINQISQRLGIGYGTAWNYVQRLKEGETRKSR